MRRHAKRIVLPTLEEPCSGLVPFSPLSKGFPTEEDTTFAPSKYYQETYEKAGSEWKLKTMRVSCLRAEGV
jgi:hypothetical protein